MPGITVFNRQQPWKRLTLVLNVDKYYRPGFDGDECWVLYLKAIGAKDTEGDNLESKIISTRYKVIISRFNSSWTVDS